MRPILINARFGLLMQLIRARHQPNLLAQFARGTFRRGFAMTEAAAGQGVSWRIGAAYQ